MKELIEEALKQDLAWLAEAARESLRDEERTGDRAERIFSGKLKNHYVESYVSDGNALHDSFHEELSAWNWLKTAIYYWGLLDSEGLLREECAA